MAGSGINTEEIYRSSSKWSYSEMDSLSFGENMIKNGFGECLPHICRQGENPSALSVVYKRVCDLNSQTLRKILGPEGRR